MLDSTPRVVTVGDGFGGLAHPQSFFASRRENFANARHAFNRTNALYLARNLPSRERGEELG